MDPYGHMLIYLFIYTVYTPRLWGNHGAALKVLETMTRSLHLISDLNLGSSEPNN